MIGRVAFVAAVAAWLAGAALLGVRYGPAETFDGLAEPSRHLVAMAFYGVLCPLLAVMVGMLGYLLAGWIVLGHAPPPPPFQKGPEQRVDARRPNCQHAWTPWRGSND